MINCLHFTTGKTGCPPQLKFSLINIDAEDTLEILHYDNDSSQQVA
jgi:hypothetical protein